MKKLIQKAREFQAERQRVRALNIQLEGLTDPGLIDRILMGDPSCPAVAPPVPADRPRPVFNPRPRPVRSIDGIMRYAL